MGLMEYLPTKDEILNWNKIPCLRESLMRGLGCGLGCSVVWGILSRSPRGVIDGMFLGAMVGSSWNWITCRRNDRIRRECVNRMLLLQSKVPSAEALAAGRAEELERVNEAVADVGSTAKNKS
jgi:hypothetical protein